MGERRALGVLVMRGGGLGDALVAMPAVRLLKRRFQAARVDLLGDPRWSAITGYPGLCDSVRDSGGPEWAGLLFGQMRPRQRDHLSEWLLQHRLVLNFLPDAENVVGDNLARLGYRSWEDLSQPRREEWVSWNGDGRGLPARLVLSASSRPATAPAAAHFARPLEALGITGQPSDWALRLHFDEPDPAESASASEPRGAPFFCVHPGSGSRAKNLPFDLWVRVADSLRATAGLDAVWVIGEAEHAIAHSVRSRAKEAGERVLERLPLVELARHLGACRLFLGHDSGVGHLAAATGAPCLLAFGPTDPEIWAPPHPRVRVLRAGPGETWPATPGEVAEAAVRHAMLSHVSVDETAFPDELAQQ